MYYCFCFGCIVFIFWNETFTLITRSIPLWEGKWNAEALQDRKKAIGNLAFGRGYRQEPINDENLLFKHFKECFKYEKLPNTIGQHLNHYTGVDPAGKNRPGSVILGYISLVKQISPDKSLPIKGFTTGKNKHDEREGLPGLEIDFENGAWEIYLGEKKHDFNCLCPWCVWQNEMTSFPGCENIDTIMACWFAWEAIRFYSGVRVRYAER